MDEVDIENNKDPKEIPIEQIAINYIQSELEKPDKPTVSETFNEKTSFEQMQELSSLRGNRVAEILSRKDVVWSEEMVSSNLIVLPRINGKVEPYLEEAKYRLSDFMDILKKLEEKSTFPSELSEFKYDPMREVLNDQILGVKDGELIRIFDGAHRLVSLAWKGETDFKIVVGRTI